jgi:DNA-binding response OmpR family regulator
MAKVLVVEDDPGILLGLVRNLEFEGYEVASARTGEAGLRLALERLPDLLILDINLPDLSGFEICKLVRREGLTVPILFLSARGAERDKVDGLKLGGDDYITKPFGIQELLARVQAALRRARRRDGTDVPFSFGPYRVDFVQRRLFCHDREVEITDREFALLAYLIGNAERALDREKILREVWGYGYEGTARTIDNFITRLRKKLEVDPTQPRIIVTVRGHGYRFCPKGDER